MIIKNKPLLFNLYKALSLFILVATLGFLTSWVLWSKTPKLAPTNDPIHPIGPYIELTVGDTINDVRDKRALFIGDSHTANHNYGWQIQLCQATGLRQNNISVGGKTTSWMLQQAKMSINSNYDYCFIYGGANDMYNSHISASMAFNNIQYIVNICKFKGVKAVVLTGFDYSVCTRTGNVSYPVKGKELQEMLLGQLQNAIVVDTRVVSRSDCGDALCHMSYSGHKKVAEKVIKDLALRKF